MERWSIPNAGEIQFELMDDFGKDTKTIKELLSGIINGMAERTVDYYHLTNGKDHAFIDSEKAIQPTITMAIAKITPVFKPEFPAWRVYSTKRRGNLDYWIYYKKITFAMELKFSHKGFYRNHCCEDGGIFRDHNKALYQLEGIEYDKLLSFMDDTKAIIKMVFHPIVFYSNAKRLQGGFTDNLEKYQDKIEKSFNTMFDDTIRSKKGYKFEKQPNFRALWFLDENISYLETGKMNKNYYYPAVGFIGHIEKC